MNVGDLRRRIEIGRYVGEKDQWGDPLPDPVWQAVCSPWAAVEGLRGSQLFQSQQTVDRSDHKVTIRYRKGIEPGMIVRHDNRELTITAALDEDGTRKWLTLHCREEKPS